MDLHKNLLKILNTNEGVTTIFITDRDGIVMMSVGNELRGRQLCISSHHNALEQMDKLEIGIHEASLFFYEHLQVIIFTMSSVCVFVVANSDANTSSLIKLREKFKPMQKVLDDVISQIEMEIGKVPMEVNISNKTQDKENGSVVVDAKNSIDTEMRRRNRFIINAIARDIARPKLADPFRQPDMDKFRALSSISVCSPIPILGGTLSSYEDGHPAMPDGFFSFDSTESKRYIDRGTSTSPFAQNFGIDISDSVDEVQYGKVENLASHNFESSDCVTTATTSSSRSVLVQCNLGYQRIFNPHSPHLSC